MSDVMGGYRLLTHLMTGQNSQVWEVVEVSSGRHFAIKTLLPEKVRNEELRQLLFHEAEVGKELSHPNIVKIIRVVKQPNQAYFVMEFFPSGSLRLKLQQKQVDYIKEHVHGLFKQAATGLAFMNAKGWIHRDVKPDNMLANAAGELKLIDFALAQRPPTGLAKLFYMKRTPQGTRSYMSPEQIRGEILDTRADMYSFAASAFEIVCGRPPFTGASNQDLLQKHIKEKPPPPQIFNPDVSEDFASLILRMLAKKREDRPHDFHEFLMQFKNMKVFKSHIVQKNK